MDTGIFGWTMFIVLDQRLLLVNATRTVLGAITVAIMKILGSGALVRHSCIQSKDYYYLILGYDTTSCTSGSVKLYSAFNHPSSEGTILYCLNGQWTAICDYSYNYGSCYIGKTVCKQLGYSGAIGTI